MQFMTSDGYRLRKDGDIWSTQGGDTFDCGADGRPIDCFGDRLDGEYVADAE